MKHRYVVMFSLVIFFAFTLPLLFKGNMSCESSSFTLKGEKAVYEITAEYVLKNPFPVTIYNDLIYITLPLNYSFYQRAYLVSMNPEPLTVVKDLDNNSFAVLKLEKVDSGRKVKINAKYIVEVYSYKINFPVEQSIWPPPEIARGYTSETSIWPIHNETLRKLAFQIKGDEENPYLIAKKIVEWVYEHGSYTMTNYTARRRLGAGRCVLNTSKGLIVQGVCDEYADVIITLNRILGIPARTAHGLIYLAYSPVIAYFSNETKKWEWTGHAWPQIYIEPVGWFDVELLVGPELRIGNYTNNHLLFGVEGKKLRPAGIGADVFPTISRFDYMIFTFKKIGGE